MQPNARPYPDRIDHALKEVVQTMASLYRLWYALQYEVSIVEVRKGTGKKRGK